MKDYDKNKASLYFKYCLDWQCFKWVEGTPQFNEDFMKNCNDNSDTGYFLEVNVQYPE